MSLLVPFIYADPATGEILNLNSIRSIAVVQKKVISPLASKARGSELIIAVSFLDGSLRQFVGRPAEIIQGSANMHRQLAESMVVQMLEPANIVVPGDGPLVPPFR